MPIFELDEGRPRLVQPMQPLAGSFAQECEALVAHHLTAIAGEPLFPVRSRTGAPDHAHLPALLALDATGRPVVVEIVQVVDDDAVVTALRHAGAAARMTMTDLSRAYHADPSRFGVEFAAFREQVAFGAQTSRREGVRLLLLCSEVAAEAGDTLGFLRGPGRHVDILQIGVVRGADDRRLLDVSPLAKHEASRRAVEPTALRLVRASESTFADAMAYDDGRRGAPSLPPVSKPPVTKPPVNTKPWTDHPSSGELRSVPSPPPMPRPAPPSPLTPRTSDTRPNRTVEPPQQPATGLVSSPVAQPSPAQPTPAQPSPAQPTQARPTTGVGPGAFPAASPVAQPNQPYAPERRSHPRGGAQPPAALPVVPGPIVPRPDTSPEARQPEPDPVTPTEHDLVPAVPTTPAQRASLPPIAEAGLVDVPNPRLATLAKQRRAMTTLVWHRERRNQRVLAMLRRDGLIQLEAGRVFADPGHAAAAAIGTDGEIDGWRAWRLGDGGPTLGEATGFNPS